MGSIAIALKHMLAANMPHDEIVLAVSELEEAVSTKPILTARQLRNQRYYEAKRLKASESKTIKTDQDGLRRFKTPTEPSRVVYTSLPSLRSEELTSEANASSVDASKSENVDTPKSKTTKSRGTRLPEDWHPSEADVEAARTEGLTDEEIQRGAVEFRNYWCARTRDATKLSWSRTWHNRVLEIADRKRRNGPRLVASADNAGGGRRGAVSFADIYFGRHGTAAE
jgi:hypothetical protein